MEERKGDKVQEKRIPGELQGKPGCAKVCGTKAAPAKGWGKSGGNMKKILQGVVCLGVLTTVLLMTAAATEAHECSTMGAAGRYGFTLTGVLITSTGAVPVAAVGKATVDVSGHVTGGESRSVGGDYAEETMSGTLVVNSDCTGTMTVEFFENGALVRTSVLNVVFVNGQTELQMVQKSLTLPDGTTVPVVITANAKKQFLF